MVRLASQKIHQRQLNTLKKALQNPSEIAISAFATAKC